MLQQLFRLFLPVVLFPHVPASHGAREGLKQVYIQDADIAKYGFTANCRRCTLIRNGEPARGGIMSLRGGWRWLIRAVLRLPPPML